jgi:hypothetical protein
MYTFDLFLLAFLMFCCIECPDKVEEDQLIHGVLPLHGKTRRSFAIY